MYNVVTYYPRKHAACPTGARFARSTYRARALAHPLARPSVRRWSETHLARTRQLLEWEGQTDGRASAACSVAPFPCT